MIYKFKGLITLFFMVNILHVCNKGAIYKKPGHYLNKYKDHYRLYKGHCEYRNGKYVRIVYEYLGTITGKDGLIPSKGLINSDVLVYEKAW